MTDSEQLASLTIKDLRQLAGEHQISNRSRLGRDELIEALQAAIQARTAEPAATAAPALSQPAQTQPIAMAAIAAGDGAPVAQPPVFTPEPVQEPELLDASALAAVTGDAPPAVVDAAQAADADGEGDDDAGSDGLDGDDQPGDQPGENSDPERRRRRRRRRGRGRGRGPDGQPVNGGIPGDADVAGASPATGPEDVTAAAAAIVEQLPEGSAPAAISSANPAEVVPQQQFDQPRRDDRGPRDGQRRDDRGPRDGRRDDRGPRRDDRGPRDDQRRDDRGPRDDQRRDDRPRDDQRRDDRPRDDQRRDDRGPRDQRDGQRRDDRPQGDGNRMPRPRLDGLQRHVGSVLDRLCTFSKGLIELCDPSTPSWAQARIAELLAEAGVSPTPCTGLPHPDFHQIVGTQATTTVPAGHISEIAAPGFSLRGDRGDLFPLKKAQVRVAEGARQPLPVPIVPQATPVAPLEAAPVAVAPEAQPVQVASQPVEVMATPVVAAVPAVQVAPVEVQVTQAVAAPVTHEAVTEQEPVQERRDPRPVIAPPAQGRDPHRRHGRESAEAAPALPLAPQIAEELAARPKAEGFRALGLNDQILADLAAVGWKEPSPIQVEGIPHALARRDMLGQAQTGTGKTGAFALPLLQRLYSLERPQGSPPVVLCLAPTRELARQVHNEIVKMAGASGARTALIYGGVPMDEQFRALERGPHIVVGTPGRVIDLMKRRALDLSQLEALVLDEADQMLDIGFWPDIQYVVGHTPPSRQMLLFSATFPQPILDLISRHMKDPVHVRIAPKQVTVEQVDQAYIAVAQNRKNDLLDHFIERQDPPQLVVFCKTKHQTDRVAEVLKRRKKSAAAIHGDLPQSRREKTLQAFRDGELQCLIATNVAARGLDIPTVSHVVNYDVPETPEEYVHRIGRTARNGAKGVARTFITPEDGQFLLEIEKHIGLLLEEEVVDGFSNDPEAANSGPKRILAETQPGSFQLLKPISGSIRLGRRRR
jgi:ATP-dependent RNA helicase DeaD